MPTGTPRPALSVVVVAFTGRPDLLRDCLQALAEQRDSGDLEVIVIAPTPVGTDTELEWLSARFAGGFAVRETPDLTIPHMRRVGITMAHGDVVALIEDDCVVAPGWAAAFVNAHRDHHAAVGGAVEPGSYRRLLDWAAYLSDYWRFMLPIGRGHSSRLPGNNVPYTRDVIDELLAITADNGLQEAFVHERWHVDGKSLLAEPAAVVRNEHRWGIRDVTCVPFHHGRAFGGQRAQNWSVPRRAVFAVASAALPVLHVIRIVQRVRNRGTGGVPVLRALPWLGVFGVSWAAGECLGYAAGAGASLKEWR